MQASAVWGSDHKSVPSDLDSCGKEAFGKELKNENFVGNPRISTSRVTEENGVVCAEGAVKLVSGEW